MSKDDARVEKERCPAIYPLPPCVEELEEGVIADEPAPIAQGTHTRLSSPFAAAAAWPRDVVLS